MTFRICGLPTGPVEYITAFYNPAGMPPPNPRMKRPYPRQFITNIEYRGTMSNEDMEPGDLFYPDHLVKSSQPYKGLEIVKGCLYTKGDNGLLKWPDLKFTRGLYQAAESASLDLTRKTVGCFGPGSRVGIRSRDGVIVGDLVRWDSRHSRVDRPSDLDPFTSMVGRVMEICAKDDSGSPRTITENGDIVVIELGRT
ncbi:hypothetical protein CENSYa_0229 [Cenarchaeum symbiosum A]|uniref:Uncharacterized protein n=1 Tax=Cenarchaeum symbiosum (strain A) TaxID=414004 RepID=A0RU55_CENSY|nr:hypothetical protein CENSYa_0229 [Cenarchaeum symbiosum A]